MDEEAPSPLGVVPGDELARRPGKSRRRIGFTRLIATAIVPRIVGGMPAGLAMVVYRLIG